jgi:hypothetical protein
MSDEREKLSANTNETTTTDEGVDAHRLAVNVNESLVEDESDVESHKMAINTNETVTNDE